LGKHARRLEIFLDIPQWGMLHLGWRSKMITKLPTHDEQLVALRRIEGQVRGVQSMIKEKRYCIDILTQLSAVASAVGSVQDIILSKHLDTCVIR